MFNNNHMAYNSKRDNEIINLIKAIQNDKALENIIICSLIAQK